MSGNAHCACVPTSRVANHNGAISCPRRGRISVRPRRILETHHPSLIPRGCRKSRKLRSPGEERTVEVRSGNGAFSGGPESPPAFLGSVPGTCVATLHDRAVSQAESRREVPLPVQRTSSDLPSRQRRAPNPAGRGYRAILPDAGIPSLRRFLAVSRGGQKARARRVASGRYSRRSIRHGSYRGSEAVTAPNLLPTKPRRALGEEACRAAGSRATR